PVTESLERQDDELAKILGDAALEAKRTPPGGEHAGGDRAAGHARDAVQSSQDAQLVEPAERAAVEQRRAEPSAREREADAGLNPFHAERHCTPPSEALVSPRWFRGPQSNPSATAREHG